MTTYRIGSYAFKLVITGDHSQQAEHLQVALERILQRFQTDEAAPARKDPPGVVKTPFGSLCWFSDFSTHYLEIRLAPDLTASLLAIVDMFEPHIVNQAVRESSGFLWIHGACLVRDGQLILLSAESGTGKTTLSLGLLSRGYRLITDDIILIDLVSRTLVPVPRCPKIRPTAGGYLRAVGFDLSQEAQLWGRYVLLPPERFQLAPVSLPIQRIYNLQRQNAPALCENLDIVSGLLSLVSRSNLIGIDPGLEQSTEIFRETCFYSMNLYHFPDDLDTIAHTASNLS